MRKEDKDAMKRKLELTKKVEAEREQATDRVEREERKARESANKILRIKHHAEEEGKAKGETKIDDTIHNTNKQIDKIKKETDETV